MEHNAQSIIHEASSTLLSSGIAAAQNIYKSAILDWVDDVTMGDDVMDTEEGGRPDAVMSDGGGVKEQLAELWCGYALLNRGANLVSLSLLMIIDVLLAVVWLVAAVCLCACVGCLITCCFVPVCLAVCCLVEALKRGDSVQFLV
jgi:hypothetical protein